MSRISVLDAIYTAKKGGNALDFNYDKLCAPPIRSIFNQYEISALYRIATSIRYNANIEKKYELIDSIMTAKGFKKAHCGTNRIVYNFLEMPTFVAKVALDKVGLADSPAEFKNQEFFKPFCCKIFEVDPSGVIAFVERVNPITSLEEFLSISDDVFNMMITKIIGRYVVDDLGTEKFMNYGLRYNADGTTFGPVIIDFPYAYELDGAKLYCNREVFPGIRCKGEIDYDNGFNKLICNKCGKVYKAQELKKDDKDILLIYTSDNGGIHMRARIVANGKVIKDTGYSSDSILTKDEYAQLTAIINDDDCDERIVSSKEFVQYNTRRNLAKGKVVMNEKIMNMLKDAQKENIISNPALDEVMAARILGEDDEDEYEDYDASKYLKPKKSIKKNEEDKKIPDETKDVISEEDNNLTDSDIVDDDIDEDDEFEDYTSNELDEEVNEAQNEIEDENNSEHAEDTDDMSDLDNENTIENAPDENIVVDDASELEEDVGDEAKDTDDVTVVDEDVRYYKYHPDYDDYDDMYDDMDNRSNRIKNKSKQNKKINDN